MVTIAKIFIQISTAFGAQSLAVLFAKGPEGKLQYHLLLDGVFQIDFFALEVNYPRIFGAQFDFLVFVILYAIRRPAHVGDCKAGFQRNLK